VGRALAFSLDFVEKSPGGGRGFFLLVLWVFLREFWENGRFPAWCFCGEVVVFLWWMMMFCGG
jgi:hypothetical protein